MDQIPSYEEAVATSQPQAATPSAEHALPSYEEAVAQSSSKEDMGPVPSFEDAQKAVKYNEPLQQAGAFVEGIAHGALSAPIATGIELGLSKLGVPGLSAEDIAGRAEANPGLHGAGLGAGFVGSMLTGVGEGALLAKAGVAATEALGLASAASTAGKIGSLAIKGLIDNVGIQSGEEINKQMLGIGDPNAPVAAALTNIGAAGLFGGAIGGGLGAVGMGASSGLKSLANTKIGQKSAQFLEDFGSQWGFNQENPNRVASVYSELSQFFKSNADTMDGVYGPTGLKAQAIQKLVPEMSDTIGGQNQKILNTLQGKIKEMVSDPESYPKRLTQKLMSEANEWMEVATNPQANSNEIFNATQSLKQRLQAYSKFDKQVGPLSAEKDFINLAKNLQHDLVRHLEDTSVWGQAGELQKGINKAFSEFLPAQKDFISKFASKVEGDAVIDPMKARTYMNQLGKSGADISEELRPKILKNYIDAAESYRGQIDDLYGRLGVDSPIEATPLSVVKSTYGEQTAGARAADAIHGPGISKVLGHVAGTLTGGLTGKAVNVPGGETVGALAGDKIGEVIANYLEKYVGRPIKGRAIPAVLKTLSVGSPRAVSEAIDHAMNVARGDTAMAKGIASLFTGSKIVGQQFINDNPKHLEKIKDFIAGGGVNQQIQNTLQEQERAKKSAPIQGFAHGGEVKQAEPVSTPIESKGMSKLSEVYPDHTMLMEAAKGRVYNYLNTLRPQSNQQRLSFDDEHISDDQKKAYESAVKIANKPLSILPKIQKGTITADHVKHLTQMWPEIHTELSKKITEKLMQGQLKGEKPSVNVRQGLSLFLGAPLDKNMTPANIQAAQSVFASRKAAVQMQAQAQGKTKKGTTGLSDASNQYQTAGQAAESRQTTARR